MLKRMETGFERMEEDSVGMEVEVEIDVVPELMNGEVERLVTDSGRMGSPIASVGQSAVFVIVMEVSSNPGSACSSSIPTQFLKLYLIPFQCHYYLPAKPEHRRTTYADVFARLLHRRTTYQQYLKLRWF